MTDDRLSYGITSSIYADPETDEAFSAPPGHRGHTPQGLSFIDAMVCALLSEEWEVPYRWVTPEGHACEVRGGGRRFDLSLACVDRDTGAWDLFVEVRRGFLPWRRKPGGDSLALLGTHIEEILRVDSKVRGVELDD